MIQQDKQISAIFTHIGRYAQKGYNMLSTIVMSLLAIWLVLMILGYAVGGVFSYKLWKSLANDENNK